MNTNKEDMRELAAQLYAVVVSTMSGSELNTAVHNLVKITKDHHVRDCPPSASVGWYMNAFILLTLDSEILMQGQYWY